MPSNIIKGLAKKARVSVSEVEDKWKKAVDIAEETFGKKERNFDDNDYAYVTGIVKNMLGIRENKKTLSTTDYIESSLSAKEWLEKYKEFQLSEEEDDLLEKDDKKDSDKGTDKGTDKDDAKKKDKDKKDDDESEDDEDSEDDSEEKEKDEKKKCKKDKK